MKVSTRDISTRLHLCTILGKWVRFHPWFCLVSSYIVQKTACGPQPVNYRLRSCNKYGPLRTPLVHTIFPRVKLVARDKSHKWRVKIFSHLNIELEETHKSLLSVAADRRGRNPCSVGRIRPIFSAKPINPNSFSLHKRRLCPNPGRSLLPSSTQKATDLLADMSIGRNKSKIVLSWRSWCFWRNGESNAGPLLC